MKLNYIIDLPSLTFDISLNRRVRSVNISDIFLKLWAKRYMSDEKDNILHVFEI